MSIARRYEDLDVWKQARLLAASTYKITENLRSRDLFLMRQMRGAAVSILSNIAEGFGRSTNKEFAQFLSVSRASASELQSQCYIALDQQFITGQDFARMYENVDHISRMLSKLIKYLRSTHYAERGTPNA